MSNLYLIRHGQAGTRNAYDALSDLGRRQCHLLGEWFASQGTKFAAAYCGEMSRQQQTAMAVRIGYGDGFPEVVLDSAWNEFDLDGMYRELAPTLCAESPEFKAEYEAMRRLLDASAGAQEADVHRRWLPCDSSLVEAWISGRHPYAGESWIEFYKRVASCGVKLNSTNRRDNIVIFTSATPISIWAALALDITDARVMKLAGSLYNASFTMMKYRNDSLRLLSFNETPHLPFLSMRTFR